MSKTHNVPIREWVPSMRYVFLGRLRNQKNANFKMAFYYFTHNQYIMIRKLGNIK